MAALEDYADADPVDLAVALGASRAIMTAFVNTHYHFEEGLIDAGIWGPQRRSLENTLLRSQYPGFSRMMAYILEAGREEIPVRFRPVVDSILMQREDD